MNFGGGAFPATRWSAILGLRSADETERARSFDALAGAYWKPAYKHARRRWNKPSEEAKDLVQEFFLRALEKDFFASYDPARARFRTYLRLGLDRFLANEMKAAARLKRGGEIAFVPFDVPGAEAEIAGAGVLDPASIEREFDRDWARSLLDRAVGAFRDECAAADRALPWRVFERYDLCASPEERPTYEALGRELGIPATSITNHLASARRALRRIVLEQLRTITVSDEEFRDEARFLLGHDPDGGR